MVFRALAEDVPGWSEWFSAVTLARPTGDGAGREIRLRGGTRFQETVLVAEAPEVYAYRMEDVSNAPDPGLWSRSGGWLRPGRAPGSSGPSPSTARPRSGWP